MCELIWRDIETAPKDGTIILAHNADRVFDVPRNDVALIYWPSHWHYPTWANAVTGEPEPGNITHWMPLPGHPGA
jgi:hypothetical protein